MRRRTPVRAGVLALLARTAGSSRPRGSVAAVSSTNSGSPGKIGVVAGSFTWDRLTSRNGRPAAADRRHQRTVGERARGSVADRSAAPSSAETACWVCPICMIGSSAEPGKPPVAGSWRLQQQRAVLPDLAARRGGQVVQPRLVGQLVGVAAAADRGTGPGPAPGGPSARTRVAFAAAAASTPAAIRPAQASRSRAALPGQRRRPPGRSRRAAGRSARRTGGWRTSSRATRCRTPWSRTVSAAMALADRRVDLQRTGGFVPSGRVGQRRQVGDQPEQDLAGVVDAALPARSAGGRRPRRGPGRA